MDVRTFCNRHGIKAVAEWADRNPDMDDMPAGSSHWRVTLRMGRKRMTVPYSMGPAHSHEPTAPEVLECLASDAGGYDAEGSFEGWAESYGYSPDSRKAERVYRAVERQTARLRAFLGDDLYRVLLYETDY